MVESGHYAVHLAGGAFGLFFVHVQDLEGEGIVAERHGDNIAGFDFFCRFHGFAVYLYASAGAGFRRDGAPFYDARNFEKFVYPHVFHLLFGGFFRSHGGSAEKIPKFSVFLLQAVDRLAKRRYNRKMRNNAYSCPRNPVFWG